MKVVVVTQYYPPEPVTIARSVALGLAERGHDVVVLTAFPNYPDGRLYPGYRQRLRFTETDGPLLVKRVPIFVSHSNNALGRAVNYLSFGVSAAVAWRSARHADVVYCYATQMTASIPGSWWQRLHRLPFVMHVQDLWPESITGSSMAGGRSSQRLIARVLGPWLHGLYQRAAATIGTGPGMTRILVERGVPSARAHSVFNWAQNPDVTPVSGRPAAISGLRVMFAGNIGEMQDLETVVEAAALVRDLKDFVITIVGSGVAEERIRRLVKDKDLPNVKFVGRVPFEAMRPFYEESDFQLVTLKDLPVFRGTIPLKLPSSFAFGVPVITTVEGDAAEIVEQEGAGFAVFSGRPADLAAAFRTAYLTTPEERTAMGRRARAFYDRHMSREKGLDEIERILIAAAGRSAEPLEGTRRDAGS